MLTLDNRNAKNIMNELCELFPPHYTLRLLQSGTQDKTERFPESDLVPCRQDSNLSGVCGGEDHENWDLLSLCIEKCVPGRASPFR
jgi:hypothetical protein